LVCDAASQYNSSGQRSGQCGNKQRKASRTSMPSTVVSEQRATPDRKMCTDSAITTRWCRGKLDTAQ